jgi:hypothetical protein
MVLSIPHTFQVALAFSVIGVPLAAIALPFKPDPTSFAIYLGKNAIEDGSRMTFSNLAGCAASGKGMKESYPLTDGWAAASEAVNSATLICRQ